MYNKFLIRLFLGISCALSAFSNQVLAADRDLFSRTKITWPLDSAVGMANLEVQLDRSKVNAFLLAAKQGNVAKIEEYLKEPKYRDLVKAYGIGALAWAASHNKMVIVQKLLSHVKDLRPKIDGKPVIEWPIGMKMTQ